MVSWPQKRVLGNKDVLLTTRTRATCKTDNMVPIGTEFTNMAHEVAGQQCTTGGLTNTDTACAHYYGQITVPVVQTCICEIW